MNLCHPAQPSFLNTSSKPKVFYSDAESQGMLEGHGFPTSLTSWQLQSPLFSGSLVP